MPSHAHYAHHRSLGVATVFAAAAHGYLSILGMLGFLNYTVPTRYELLDEVASATLWAWLHGITAVILIASLANPCWRVHRFDAPIAAVVTSVGFAFMFVWAFFNMLWGLTTIRPVSLAGPGLAFSVAVGEQLLANAWNRWGQNEGSVKNAARRRHG